MIDRRRMLAAAAAFVGAGGAACAGPRKSDLTGVWTNAWYTQLERPKAFKTLAVTPAEAEAYEAPRRALRGELVNKEDKIGQNESEFPDNGPGLARIRGEIRSSWIVDPADGRLPLTAQGKARIHPDKPPPEDFDNVEARPTDERCLTVTGAMAPMINSHDGNVLQIVQTPQAVLILGEKNHDTRIIRLDGFTDLGGGWLGVSTGRWEGQTLVAETTGLRPGLTKISNGLWLSDKSRVVERLTRSGPNEISYLFEVDDPVLFTRPWRAEMVFRTAEGLLYEYACHEGNYSLPSILAAARQGNQVPEPEEPAKAAK